MTQRESEAVLSGTHDLKSAQEAAESCWGGGRKKNCCFRNKNRVISERHNACRQYSSHAALQQTAQHTVPFANTLLAESVNSSSMEEITKDIALYGRKKGYPDSLSSGYFEVENILFALVCDKGSTLLLVKVKIEAQREKIGGEKFQRSLFAFA